MTCPVCGGKTTVINSRPTCECVNRTRKCLECGFRFKTVEYEKVFAEKEEDDDQD